MDHIEKASARFVDAGRLQTNLLADVEKRCLIWIARRLPARVTPDHLTALGALSMLGTGLGYAYAGRDPAGLLIATACLAMNWFGDSLDGTVARVRNQQRPRYGFYVDHVLDAVGSVFLFTGMAMSGFMSSVVALGLLAAYLLVSVEVYLAAHCVGSFRMSFWKFGPTELRILLALGNVALLFHPSAMLFGTQYRLLDAGGVIAIAGLVLTMGVGAVRNMGTLYREEPIAPHGLRTAVNAAAQVS